MAKRSDVETTETEGGFGTGLRAKVKRVQEGPDPEVEAVAPKAPGELEPQPPVAAGDLGAGQVLDALQSDIWALQNEVEAARSELQAALVREAELRQAIAEQQERELHAGASLGARSGELDDRAGRL